MRGDIKMKTESNNLTFEYKHEIEETIRMIEQYVKCQPKEDGNPTLKTLINCLKEIYSQWQM